MAPSKVQRQVLALYKSCLRAATNKPGFQENVRFEFKKNASIPRTEFMRIEQLMRNGQRKLKMIQDPNVSGMGQFVEDKK